MGSRGGNILHFLAGLCLGLILLSGRQLASDSNMRGLAEGSDPETDR